MKNVFLIILCVLMAACVTTKKSTQIKETTNLVAQKSELETTNAEKLIDTTKVEKGKITITEIEFYPPAVTDNQLDKKASLPRTNVSGLNLQSVGNIGNAAIKSIKQTAIETDSQKKGESKESSLTTNVKNEAVVANTEKVAKVKATPVSDPIGWRYIFYILLLAAMAFLYLKRGSILNWIKIILSGIR